MAVDPEAVDLTNLQMVGTCRGNVVTMMPMPEMTPAQALVHAAWLVAITGEEDVFTRILERVCSI